jgi:hypothetical protein
MTKFVRLQGSAPIEERIMSKRSCPLPRVEPLQNLCTRVAHKTPDLVIRRPLPKDAPPPKETDRNASKCSDGVPVQQRGARYRKIGFRRSRRSSVALSECVLPLGHLPKSLDFNRQRSIACSNMQK